MPVAYLGDEYSYSHEAATALASGCMLRAYDTMSKVIAAVGNECAAAVLPVENNTEGAVGEVFDALCDSKLFIQKQAVLPITHSLIAVEGGTIENVTRIVSHAQAIGQCRRFLSTLDCKVEAAPSTSAGLRLVDEHTAAIAFKPRAGQTVIASGIQDSALNATRFALVGTDKCVDGDTVSILFDIKNEPGALAKLLVCVYGHGINLTRIISRPHRSGNGEYRFFADFEYGGTPDELDALVRELGGYCTMLCVLGRYDVINIK